MHNLAIREDGRTPYIDGGATTHVLKPGYQNLRRELSTPPARPWQNEAVQSLTELCLLPQNWDGANSPPVSNDVAMFALTILQKAMSDRTPAPSFVPASGGGLQVEWHMHGIDLELFVAAPYECEVWFTDQTGRLAAISEELTSDFSAFDRAVRELTRR